MRCQARLVCITPLTVYLQRRAGCRSDRAGLERRRDNPRYEIAGAPQGPSTHGTIAFAVALLRTATACAAAVIMATAAPKSLHRAHTFARRASVMACSAD